MRQYINLDNTGTIQLHTDQFKKVYVFSAYYRIGEGLCYNCIWRLFLYDDNYVYYPYGSNQSTYYTSNSSPSTFELHIDRNFDTEGKGFILCRSESNTWNGSTNPFEYNGPFYVVTQQEWKTVDSRETIIVSDNGSFYDLKSIGWRLWRTENNVSENIPGVTPFYELDRGDWIDPRLWNTRNNDGTFRWTKESDTNSYIRTHIKGKSKAEKPIENAYYIVYAENDKGDIYSPYPYDMKCLPNLDGMTQICEINVTREYTPDTTKIWLFRTENNCTDPKTAKYYLVNVLDVADDVTYFQYEDDGTFYNFVYNASVDDYGEPRSTGWIVWRTENDTNYLINGATKFLKLKEGIWEENEMYVDDDGVPEPSKLRLHIPYDVNRKLIMNSQELLEIYLFGIPMCNSDGTRMSEESIVQHIMAAQEFVENLFSIKLYKQDIVESRDYERQEFMSWGFIRTTYPINHFIKLEGYINNICQINYPIDWVSYKKSNEVATFRNAYLLPNSNSSMTQNSLIYFGISPHLGWFGQDYIPNYWKLQYNTGFDKIPADLQDFTMKKAAMNVLLVIGDILYGIGTTQIDVDLDGVHQCTSLARSAQGSLFQSRVVNYINDLNTMLKVLKGRYCGISFEVL